MHENFLNALARRPLPAFVTARGEIKLLRRLYSAGYVDARFFPQEQSEDQFAELRSLTPLGRRFLDIVMHREAGPG